MISEQLTKIKADFKSLQGVLESSNSVDELLKNNPDFEKAFSDAMRGLGAIEEEWILEIPERFNSRDAIESALVKIETIQAYVRQGIIPQAEGSLEERLKAAKEILKKANEALAGKK